MAKRQHDWWQQWRLLADEATTRTRRVFGTAPDAPAHSYQRLQATDLEPRILFSATPIDATSMPGADQPAMVIEVDSQETESDSATIEGITQQAPAQQAPSEIVIIDSAVPELQQLLDDLYASERGLDVFVLEGDRDGLDQISEILDQHREIDSLHIISHAEDGGVKLGKVWLSETNVVAYAGQIAAWQDALTDDADILFYGCDLAENGGGQTLLESFSALTGADVAASVDDTGHSDFGGDWELEYTSGPIESQIAFSGELQQSWHGKLATITVTTFNDVVAADGLISLREAVIQANGGSGGDTIVLGAGTYTRSLNTQGEDNAASGDLDIRVDLTIQGAGSGLTIIDGGYNDRIFDVIGSHLTMADVTVQAGVTNDQGGGIRVADLGAKLTLDRVIITDNGALFGAGIANAGTMTLTDVEIVLNGGVFSTNDGGGLYNVRDATLERVTFDGNEAGNGGAIHNDMSATSLTLTNVTISGNTALGIGGGLHNQADADITNSTIVLNSANNGGGITNNGGTVDVLNTLIAANTATSNPDVESLFNSLGYNLIGDGSGSTGLFDGVNNDQVGDNMTPIDPMIDPVLLDNGGPTPTHALFAGSPAIGTATSSGAPSTDQRGVARGTSPDIGAYEDVNDPPSAVNSPGNVSYTATDPPVDVDSLITVSDPNDTHLEGASVRIVLGYTSPEDVLSFTPEPGIAGSWNAGSGLLEFTGHATLAAYQNVLRSVTYENSNSIPNTANRVLAYQLNDAEISASGGMRTIEVSAPVTNSPPTANAGGPHTINEGEDLVLDASGSSDSDGTIVQYKWDLNNDLSYDDFTSASTNPTIDWATLVSWGLDDGDVGGTTYAIGLQVVDDLGATHESTTTVTINDVAPELVTSGASSVTAGSTYTLNLSASDPGNDTIIDWIIDWGDGTVEQIGSNPVSWDHTYATTGNYDILLAAIDEDGTHLQSDLLVTGFGSSTTFTFDANTGALLDSFSHPGDEVSIEVGPDGKLYVTAYGTDVRRFLVDGTPDGTFASGNGLDGAGGMAFGPDGNLYVASFNSDNVKRFDGTTGAYIDDFISGGTVDGACNLAFGPDGHLYVSSYYTGNIEQFDGTTGVSMGVFASGLSSPEALVFGPDGNLYVASRASDQVVKLNGTTGVQLSVYSDANLNDPYGLAFAPNGYLYVAGHLSDNIVRFNATTGGYVDEIVASAPSGLNTPTYLHFLPGQQVIVVDTEVFLAPVQDTWLNTNATGMNYGGSASIVVDQAGGSLGDGRALLEFDLSNIPVGATIVSASLNLEATANTGAFDLNVYEVIEAWDEGGSDAVAGEANWSDRQALTNWTTAGGTVDPVIVATLNTTTTGQHNWDVTSLVDAWYTGTSVNHGLMIASPDLGTDTVTYDSREGTTAPELQVFYTLVNSPPTDIVPNSFAINENTDTTTGVSVGTLTASDSDAGERFIYSIVGGPDELKFSIGGTGNDELILGDGILDHETQDSYSVIVRVTDSALQTYDETITVNVNDLNDNDPTVDSGQSFDVSEFAPMGTSLGLVAASDADDGTIFSTWTITGGNSDGIFFISSGTGELQVFDPTNLNHEVNDSYALTITVSDGANTSVGQTININVIDENEAPTDISLDNNSVDENTVGAVIGNLATTDVDDGDTHSYSVSDSRFEVVLGQLKLKAGEYLDFESESSVDVTVTSTDQGGAGLSINKLFTINVNNLTEAGVTNFVPGPQNVLEDDLLVFTTFNGNAITVDDGTTGDPILRTTLTVTGGTLDLATAAGLTSVSGDGTATVTITGLESAINAALDGLTYTPTGNYNGPANLQVTTDLQGNLQGRYTFDNPAFLGEDASPPGANDGITWGSPTSTFDATRGSDVITLNGIDQNVVLAGNRFGTPSDLTLAAWVNVAATNNQEVISIGGSIALRLNDTGGGAGVTGFYHDGSTWQHTDSAQFIGNDGWHHVALTFDNASNTQVIYLDGVALGTTSYAGSINWAHQSDTTIGSHAGGTGYWLNGSLDDARIYDRALSASEIQALATDNNTHTSSIAITVDPDNDLPIGLPVITGIEQEDETLTADVTGISDDDGLGTFSYQWLRNAGVISGATSDSYLLGDDDVDQFISVEVTYIDGDGTPEGPLESDPSGLIANVNDLPIGLPSIIGLAEEDQTLTADATGISDADGLGTLDYQWLRNGTDIIGASSDTYTLGDDDVGQLISVAVGYVDNHGEPEGPLTSAEVGPIANINDNPTVANTILDQSATEGTPFSYQFDADLFDDVDGDTLAFTATLDDSSPLPSWLGFDTATRTFSGTPLHSDVGVITIRVTADDGNLGTAHEDFQLTVDDVNFAPTSVDDNYFGLNEGATYNCMSPAVIFNDSDPDGDTLTAVLVSGPSHAVSFTLDPDGCFLYQHDGSETTTDQFTYRVTDGSLFSGVAIVTLNINPQNDAPTDITLDNLNVDEATAGAVVGNLAAIDPDVIDAHIWSVSDSRFDVVAGQLKLKVAEALDFEAEPLVNLTIKAADQAGASFSKSFTITVNDINEAPIADTELFTISSGQTLDVPASGVLDGDLDPDGDTLTAVLLAGPTNGTLTLSPDGSFIYTPGDGFTGVDSFIYQAFDGSLLSPSTLVTITVQPAIGSPPPPDGDGDDDGDPLPAPPPPVDPPPEEPPPPAEETPPDTSTTSSTPPSQTQPPGGGIPVAPMDEPPQTFVAAQEANEDLEAAGEQGQKEKQAKQSDDNVDDELRSQAGNIYQISVHDPQWQDLDSFRDDLLGDWGFQTLVVGAAVSTSLSISVGYVFWTVRGGWLASALMTSMPVWRSIDPLPVLEYLDGDPDQTDDESLQSIIGQQAGDSLEQQLQ